MEGWDGDADGSPTDLVRRRWRRFGESGAKLVWGGEAVAVTHDGRANPRQLVIDHSTVEPARRAARRAGGRTRRRARERRRPRHRLAAHALRPVVATDRRAASRGSPTTIPSSTSASAPTPTALLSDDDLDALVATLRRRRCARRRRGVRLRRHQALSRLPPPRAPRRGRPAGRVRRDVRAPHRVPAPRSSRASAPACPGSVSACGCRRTTSCPTRPTPTASVHPSPTRRASARYAFGARRVGHRGRPRRRAPVPRPVSRARHRAGVHHRREPVLQPAHPAAGVLPAVRRVHAARGSSRRRGADDRGHRGARRVRIPTSRSWARATRISSSGSPTPRSTRCAPAASVSVGIGRGMLSYPHLPADVFAGRPLETSLLCRTFSDCTTAPRNGLVSGCYPLDDFYKDSPERIELAAIKKATRKRTRR